MTWMSNIWGTFPTIVFRSTGNLAKRFHESRNCSWLVQGMREKNSTARVISQPFSDALGEGYSPCISCMSNYDVESAIHQFGDPSRALLTYCLDKALTERTVDAMRLCANKILYDLRVAGFSGRDDLEERLPELNK